MELRRYLESLLKTVNSLCLLLRGKHELAKLLVVIKDHCVVVFVILGLDRLTLAVGAAFFVVQVKSLFKVLHCFVLSLFILTILSCKIYAQLSVLTA